ncbi:MAG: GGDEF domain-containing protein [Myxococcota bacterium]
MPDDWEDETATMVGDHASLARKLATSSRDRAYVVVIAGPNVGEMFRIDADQVIGRGADVGVLLMDTEISRRHAKLSVDGDAIAVEDLGSTNGTFVNGEPITRRELRDGDKIQVGTTTILKFSYHDDLDEKFQRRMYDAALRDSMTGAFNKQYFIDRLDAELAYAVRHASPLALVLFDIDHFKKVNDTHGHPAGDYVLKTLSKGILDSVRKEDVFARYGGEEFALLSRGIDLPGAIRFGERLRAWVEGFPFEFEGQRIPVTVSLGIVARPEAGVTDPPAFLQLADDALYAAKRGGRNQVGVPESLQC